MVRKVYVVGENNDYAKWINNAKFVSSIEEANIILITDETDLEINKNKAIVIGINKGAKYLCLLNGGTILYSPYHQRMTTHPLVNTSRSKEVEMTSLHNHVIKVDNLDPKDYTIYWYSKLPLSLSTVYDPEVIMFHKNIISLAIQGNPELMRPTSPVIGELNKLITVCLNRLTLTK